MLGAMALQMGTWEVEYRPRGWIRLRGPADGVTVYLNYGQIGEPGHQRLDLQSMTMYKGDKESLSARAWRRVPFSAIEVLITSPGIWEVLTAPCDVPPPSPGTLEEYFAATEDFAKIGASRLHGVIPDADTYVGDGTPGFPARELPRIKPPEGRLSDEFLGSVADAYRWFTEAKRAPAPAISEMSGVPVRTVHRWIYEARKRGFLPPARQGRAG